MELVVGLKISSKYWIHTSIYNRQIFQTKSRGNSYCDCSGNGFYNRRHLKVTLWRSNIQFRIAISKRFRYQVSVSSVLSVNNKLYYFGYYSGLAVFLVYPSGIYYKNKSSVHRGIWSNCCHDRINRNRICKDRSDFSKTFRGHENSTLLKACSRWRNYWNIRNRISGNIRYMVTAGYKLQHLVITRFFHCG